MNEEEPTRDEIQQAYDEANRELQVRGRCYPKWVKEGKLSRTDASARYAAQEVLVWVMSRHPGVTCNTENSSTDWVP